MVVKMVARPIAKLSNRLTPPPGDTRQAGDSSDGAGLAPQSPRRSPLGPQAAHHPYGLANAFGRADHV